VKRTETAQLYDVRRAFVASVTTLSDFDATSDTLAAFLLVMSRIAIALGVRNARSAAGEFVGPTQMSSALCSTR
jgi:hypothetical protein